jgi:type I restriction enzyme S subunit
MAGEWESASLSELCEQIADCPHSTPLWTDSGVIVLRNQNIRDGRLDLSSPSYTDELNFEQRSRRARLKAGDLVLTREAPMGEVCMVPENLRCCLGQRMVMLRPDPKKCDSRFLLYSIQSDAVQHEIKVNEGTGSTVSNLRIPLLEALPITLPPLAEQRAIAGVLGALDDKIELNRRMNATLESMARALFQSWFVDFDPVRAKLDGRPPTGMDKATADLFPDSFQESPLGDIPKGWNIRTLGDIARNVSITFDFNRMQDVVFINTGDVMEGDFLHVNRNPYFGLPGQAKKSIQKNDILFSEIRPANKRYAYVDFDSRDYVVSTKFMIIRGSREIHPRLLYRILTRKETLAEFQLQAESRSGTFPQITFDSINHLPIILPPTAIQEAFRHAVGCIDDQIKINKHQSRTLATLRDTLLPKLLSGKLSLADLNPAERKHAP